MPNRLLMAAPGFGQQVSSAQMLVSRVAGYGVPGNSGGRRKGSSRRSTARPSRPKRSAMPSRKSAASSGRSKRGRLVKGSAAAKAWGRKMKKMRRR